MPPVTNVDIKVRFDRYDMAPGIGGRRFRTNILNHAGDSDDRGWSLADTFLRIDEGATDAQGIPAPAAPAMPNGAAALAKAQAARRSRLKNSYKLITQHISDEMTLCW